MKRKEYKRFRCKTVTFRLSDAEYKTFQERILISRLRRNEYALKSCLEQRLEIVMGKFYSDKLSVEIRRLNSNLEKYTEIESIKETLNECRELVCQLVSLLNSNR